MGRRIVLRGTGQEMPTDFPGGITGTCPVCGKGQVVLRKQDPRGASGRVVAAQPARPGGLV